MRLGRSISVAVLLAGIFIVTLLVARSGFERTAASVLSVGWRGLGVLAGWQLVVAFVLGMAWQVVSSQASRPRRSQPDWRPDWCPDWRPDWRYVWARLVRDASAACLPFSQLGGMAIGARVLVLRGNSWPQAATSTIGDLTAEFVAQMIFTTAALVIVAGRQFAATSLSLFLTAVAVALVSLCGMLLLPRSVARLCALVAGGIAARGFGFAGARLQMIDAELRRMYGRTGSFATCSALHVVGWVGKGMGGWLAFRLLGARIGLADALAVEALLHAGLAFAVFVPGYVGVQEAGYILLGAQFGVPPEISLSVSLLRRARDTAIGVPVLLGWQVAELRRLRAAGRRLRPEPS